MSSTPPTFTTEPLRALQSLAIQIPQLHAQAVDQPDIPSTDYREQLVQLAPRKARLTELQEKCVNQVTFLNCVGTCPPDFPAKRIELMKSDLQRTLEKIAEELETMDAWADQLGPAYRRVLDMGAKETRKLMERK